MIQLKNKSEVEFNFRKLGAAAAGASAIDAALIPFDGYISAVYARFGTKGINGSGGTQKVQMDLQLDAVSIYSVLPTWDYATPSRDQDSNGMLSTNPPAVTKGQLLALFVPQVYNGSGPTQPADMTVTVVIRRKQGGVTPAGMLNGQVDITA